MAQRLSKKERLSLIDSIAKFGEHTECISTIRKQIAIELNKKYDFSFIRYYYNKIFRGRWLAQLEEENKQMAIWKEEYTRKEVNTAELEAERLYDQFTGLTVDC